MIESLKKLNVIGIYFVLYIISRTVFADFLGQDYRLEAIYIFSIFFGLVFVLFHLYSYKIKRMRHYFYDKELILVSLAIILITEYLSFWY